MAGNEMTSIVAAAGLGTELVQEAYDLVVRAALHEIPCARSIVDSRPGNPAMRGSSITLEKINFYTKADVLAATLPLDEETDVDATRAPAPTPVTITPDEYGFAALRTRKLNARSFAAVDPIIAMQIAQHQAETLDALVQAVLKTGTSVVQANNGVGNLVTATDSGDLTATNLFGAKDVRRVVARLRANKAVPFFGKYYGLLAHPYAILDLREESGPGSWREPSVYGSDQSEIWAGEIGEFEGVRVLQNALVDVALGGVATLIPVFQNYFFGKGAVVEQVYEEPHVAVAPQVDTFNRFHKIGWYGDLGWSVYENKALIRLESAASLDDGLGLA